MPVQGPTSTPGALPTPVAGPDPSAQAEPAPGMSLGASEPPRRPHPSAGGHTVSAQGPMAARVGSHAGVSDEGETAEAAHRSQVSKLLRAFAGGPSTVDAVAANAALAALFATPAPMTLEAFSRVAESQMAQGGRQQAARIAFAVSQSLMEPDIHDPEQARVILQNLAEAVARRPTPAGG